MLWLVPEGTTTHYSRQGASTAASALDHVFTASAVAKVHGSMFATSSTYETILATVRMRSRGVDPFAWKRYRSLTPTPGSWMRVTLISGWSATTLGTH